MKRSSRSKKNFIVLKQTNDADKIINFFMKSYWSKTGIFVKLMRKVWMKWKNWSDFRVLHSTQLQEEDWSKTNILSLNSLVRYRTCKMKLINCINDSRDFQDTESVRSGHSHVTSQPVSFPPHPVPCGLRSRSLLEDVWSDLCYWSAQELNPGKCRGTRNCSSGANFWDDVWTDRG